MDKYFKDYPTEVRKNLESMPQLRAKIKKSNELQNFMNNLLSEVRNKWKEKYPEVNPEHYIYNGMEPY